MASKAERLMEQDTRNWREVRHGHAIRMEDAERQKWYAVRTVPGSQKPQREFEVEATRSRKGYRIMPRLNPAVSAIERALSRAGFVHYMPAEKRLVRDRKHTDLWKPRRFALLVGYVFVLEPEDFLKLQEVEGVQHIVKDAAGMPLRIDLLDILQLRQAESQAEAFFDVQSARARKTVRLKAKRDPRLMKIVRKLEANEDATLPIHMGVIAA